MDDTELKLGREVRELRAEVRRLKYVVEAGRAEVRRLKYVVEAGFVVLAIGVAVIFPSLFRLVLLVGGLILFALLVSPVRHLIFPTIFHKRNSHEPHD